MLLVYTHVDAKCIHRSLAFLPTRRSLARAAQTGGLLAEPSLSFRAANISLLWIFFAACLCLVVSLRQQHKAVSISLLVLRARKRRMGQPRHPFSAWHCAASVAALPQRCKRKRDRMERWHRQHRHSRLYRRQRQQAQPLPHAERQRSRVWFRTHAIEIEMPGRRRSVQRSWTAPLQ